MPENCTVASSPHSPAAEIIKENGGDYVQRIQPKPGEEKD